MPSAENPAARLRCVLGALRSRPGRSTAGEAWAAALRLPPAEKKTLIVAVARTMELSERAQHILTHDGTPSPVALRWVIPVEAALIQSADLDKPVSLVTHHLDESTMLSLQACEEAISRTSGSSPSEKHVFNAIGLTDKLLGELHRADLEKCAHELMVRHVLALQQALKLYPVVGVSGLYDAMLSTLAALRVATGPQDEQKTWYQKFTGCMSTLADLLTIGQSLTMKAPQIMGSLPAGVDPLNST